MTQAARWTALIALFTIPFLPLYVSSELFFPFITGKGFAFRILVEIALAAYILLALLDKKYRPKFSWTLVLFGLLVTWMAVANVLGIHPDKAFWSNFERMDGWVMLAHLFAFFVVAGAVLGTDCLWRRWWLFFISVATLICGYGVLQLMGGAEIHQGGVRVDASFGNAIYLAVYLMFSIFVAAWLMVESRGWLRWALAGFSVLALIILFFTASRGAVIGLVGGVGVGAVLWLFLSRKEWVGNKGNTGLKIAAGSLAALVLLAGGFFLARDSAFVQSEPALARLSTVFSLSEELKVRSTIWGMAFKGVAEDPITGWGQEGFNQVFNKYYEPSLYKQEAWFDRAHSMYIDWLVAGGIPALILFVLLLGFGAAALIRAQNMSRAQRVLLVSALVAYAIQALVVFDNLFSYVPFVMLLATAHTSSARTSARLEALPELRSETGVGAATAGAVVLAIALIWTVNVPNISAAHHLVYALSPAPTLNTNLELFKKALADNSFASQEIREQLVSFASRVASDPQVPEDVRMQFAALAIEEMGKEIAIAPNDARLRLQYAAIFEATGDEEGAIAQLDQAVALSPRKQTIYLSRGYALTRLKRFEEARESFRTAYELDTSFPEIAINAAAGQILSGDVQGGKALLLESVGTTTPPDQTLLYAYYEAKQWNDLVAVARAQVALEQGAPQARFRLAQTLAAAGRFEEARAEVYATMAAHPSTRTAGEALIKEMFTPAQ